MNQVVFTFRSPRADRRHYVNESDVRVVLGRLPESLWERLRAVRFNDMGVGGRRLGYVTRGRSEISLCAVPPRVTLSRYLFRNQSPTQFGAVRGFQWPTLAVRRFLLYDVFLHELGHLQVVDARAKAIRRKFADETRAQEFADHWRRELWSRPFDHPDPVHNPPTAAEIEAARASLRNAHGLPAEGDGRAGWAEAFREMARRGDDALLDDAVPSLSSWNELEWQW